MSEKESAALSFVLLSRAGWSPVARTLEYLADQTVADRIELVLVAMGDSVTDDPPPTVERLAGYRVVAASSGVSIAEARAVGARHATAPVIAFGEDHAFPLPDWAEITLARHAEPWAVVGPVVRNANPATVTSWADFVLAYGTFTEGITGGEVPSAPGHNSTYKRAALDRPDDELVAGLAAEWLFHGRLRDEGERIYVDPRAVIRHVNFALPRPFAAVTFRAARAGAATRADGWSLPRRLAYSVGCAVLPFLRMARALRALPESQRRQVPRAALPVLFAGLMCDAAGQAVGFLDPSPDPANIAAVDLELERLRFVPAADAAALS